MEPNDLPEGITVEMIEELITELDEYKSANLILSKKNSLQTSKIQELEKELEILLLSDERKSKEIKRLKLKLIVK